MRSSSPTPLNRLLSRRGLRLFVCAEAVADLNAAGALIELLRINPDRVLVGYAGEVDRALARGRFPGHELRAGVTAPPGCLRIRFDFGTPSRMEAKGLLVSVDLLKGCLPDRADPMARRRLRKEMGLGTARRLLIFSGFFPDEVEPVLQAYGNLKTQSRPLLILGLRRPERTLGGLLARRGWRVIQRDRINGGFSSFSEGEIVVLNTRGELAHLFPAADLAILGHDRNLFEPAFQGLPILYFPAPRQEDPLAQRIVDSFDLAWRNNRLPKLLLDRFGGARPIQPRRFSQQIQAILDHPAPMREATQKAVAEFKEKVIPPLRDSLSRIVEEAILQ